MKVMVDLVLGTIEVKTPGLEARQAAEVLHLLADVFDVFARKQESTQNDDAERGNSES